jgi:hypothetical protein
MKNTLPVQGYAAAWGKKRRANAVSNYTCS